MYLYWESKASVIFGLPQILEVAKSASPRSSSILEDFSEELDQISIGSNFFAF